MLNIIFFKKKNIFLIKTGGLIDFFFKNLIKTLYTYIFIYSFNFFFEKYIIEFFFKKILINLALQFSIKVYTNYTVLYKYIVILLLIATIMLFIFH